MLPERTRDRVIFLGVVPILAAVAGSAFGALMQAQACSVVGATEIKALLENAQLNGAQKLEFMQQYMQLTDRPWSLARSVMTILTFSTGAAIAWLTFSGGFRRN